MKIPFSYIARNFIARRLTTSITVTGVALVVFVFAAVLMMSYGVQKTLVSTGSANNVIISRKSATSEISSIIDRETANNILTLPAISRGADGKPLATTDAVVIINIGKKTGGISNVTVRGVSRQAFTIREQIKLTEGRMFTWGARELVVGGAIRDRFKGANIGDKVKFAGDMWTIVGVIDGEHSAFDSEIWGDIDQLLQAFNRSDFSTITFRVDDPAVLSQLKTQFASDPRLNQFEPESERRYYEKQSEALSMFINILGIFITIIFSVGAMIGAMITMYAAVANRTVEIGTLRALGFQRFSIMMAFLIESMLIALVGGALGLFLASFLQFVSLSTLNFGSFSELQFSFSLSPIIIILTILFAVVMGLVGGFLPSFRAARLQIVNALRSA